MYDFMQLLKHVLRASVIGDWCSSDKIDIGESFDAML
jgi:hypothetical protein